MNARDELLELTKNLPKIPRYLIETRAISLLRRLHPEHEVGWHTVCLTCVEIEQVAEALTNLKETK